MDIIKLKEGIDWVGVRDPQLRVFDIIMETEYGTTYNAYLIRGAKNVLVESVKIGHYHDFSEKLDSLLGTEKIDYIIANHTEPDHSGSIKNLLTKYPNAQVICSKPASIYLKAMLNEDFNCKVAADGEELVLGGRRFRFIMAPFLHWPDTMFTYLPDEQLLFSGDVFGCHYCPAEGSIFNDEAEDFSQAFKYYFDVIMGPFKEHFLKAYEKIKDLPVTMIGTSHGPVHRKDVWQYIEQYRKWSLDAVRKSDKKYVVIAYVSAYGFTATIAERLYTAMSQDSRFDVELVDISKQDLMDMKRKIEYADGVLIGSPTFNQDALKPVWDVLSEVCPINVRNKQAAAFGSYGWSGEAVKMLEERLRSLKFKVTESGLRFNFAPSDADLEATAEFGRSFLELL